MDHGFRNRHTERWVNMRSVGRVLTVCAGGLDVEDKEKTKTRATSRFVTKAIKS